jgi:hypothetical protein
MRTATTRRLARTTCGRTGRRGRRFEALEDRRLMAWLGQIGGTGSELLQDSTVDGEGNTYITGQFGETADFDPSPAVHNLTAAGDSDVYVAKYNATGNFLWARQFGTRQGGIERGWGIAFDASGAYVTGYCDAKTDFDGDGVADLTGRGRIIFIAKLDSVTGETLWAKGVEAYLSRDITVANGSVYVTGEFNGTVDFDPGPGVNKLSATNTKGFSLMDAFVLKLDAASGGYAAAWNLGGVQTDSGHQVIADASSVFVAGSFQGTADFDPSSNKVIRTSAGSSDLFFASYTTSGALNWVQSIGNANSQSFNFGFAADATDVYVSSSFSDMLDVDPSGAALNVDATAGTAFVAKYAKATGLIDSAFTPKQFGGRDITLTLDSIGAMYIAGFYSGTIDLDPSDAIASPPAEGNGYVLKLDAAGNYVNHWHFVSLFTINALRVAGVFGDTIHIAGEFTGTATFPNGESLTSRGGDDSFGDRDLFILALDQVTTASVDVPTATADGGSVSLLDAASVEQLLAESESTWSRKSRVKMRV